MREGMRGSEEGKEVEGKRESGGVSDKKGQGERDSKRIG